MQTSIRIAESSIQFKLLLHFSINKSFYEDTLNLENLKDDFASNFLNFLSRRKISSMTKEPTQSKQDVNSFPKTYWKILKEQIQTYSSFLEFGLNSDFLIIETLIDTQVHQIGNLTDVCEKFPKLFENNPKYPPILKFKKILLIPQLGCLQINLEKFFQQTQSNEEELNVHCTRIQEYVIFFTEMLKQFLKKEYFHTPILLLKLDNLRKILAKFEFKQEKEWQAFDEQYGQFITKFKYKYQKELLNLPFLKVKEIVKLVTQQKNILYQQKKQDNLLWSKHFTFEVLKQKITRDLIDNKLSNSNQVQFGKYIDEINKICYQKQKSCSAIRMLVLLEIYIEEIIGNFSSNQEIVSYMQALKEEFEKISTKFNSLENEVEKYHHYFLKYEKLEEQVEELKKNQKQLEKNQKEDREDLKKQLEQLRKDLKLKVEEQNKSSDQIQEERKKEMERLKESKSLIEQYKKERDLEILGKARYQTTTNLELSEKKLGEETETILKCRKLIEYHQQQVQKGQKKVEEHTNFLQLLQEIKDSSKEQTKRNSTLSFRNKVESLESIKDEYGNANEKPKQPNPSPQKSYLKQNSNSN